MLLKDSEQGVLPRGGNVRSEVQQPSVCGGNLPYSSIEAYNRDVPEMNRRTLQRRVMKMFPERGSWNLHSC